MGQFADSVRIAQRTSQTTTNDGYEGGQPEQLYSQPNQDTVNALIASYLKVLDFTPYVVPLVQQAIINNPISQTLNSLTVTNNITMQNGQQVYYNGIGSPGGILGTDIRFDTITGAGGAGSGNIAPATITGYNLADFSIPFTKLTGTAAAQVVAFSTQDTSFSMLRSVSATGTSLDSNGKETDGLTLSNSATRVADSQAYRGFAITNTGMTTTGSIAVSGPGYAGLAPGMYVATVFVRVTTTTNTSTALTLQATGTAITSSTVTLAASDLQTTYLGVAVPFTVTAATNTFNIQITNNLLPATVNWLFSHVRVQQYDGKTTAGATTFFFANASITSAQIQNITASQITAGTINSDDIFIGTGGHLYAGNKNGGRVEFNSAGISAFQTVNLFSVANQSFESGVGSWSGSGVGYTTATIAVSTAQKYVGAQSLLVTWPTTTAAHACANINCTGLTIGTTYTVSTYVYVPSGSPAVRICDLFAGSTFVAGNIATTVNDTWVRVYYTFTATATNHFMGVVPNTAPTSGQTCYIDAAQLEVGTFTQYTSNTSSAATSFTLANNGIQTLTNASGASIVLDPNKGLNFYSTTGVSNLFLDMTTGNITTAGNVNLGGSLTLTGTLTVASGQSETVISSNGDLWMGGAYKWGNQYNGIFDLAGTPSTTGGSIAAGTYNYIVQVVNADGLGAATSNVVTVTTTGTTSSVAFTWTAPTAVSPTTGFDTRAGSTLRVVRGNGVAWGLVATGLAITATSYTDTAASTSAIVVNGITGAAPQDLTVPGFTWDGSQSFFIQTSGGIYSGGGVISTGFSQYNALSRSNTGGSVTIYPPSWDPQVVNAGQAAIAIEPNQGVDRGDTQVNTSGLTAVAHNASGTDLHSDFIITGPTYRLTVAGATQTGAVVQRPKIYLHGQRSTVSGTVQTRLANSDYIDIAASDFTFNSVSMPRGVIAKATNSVQVDCTASFTTVASVSPTLVNGRTYRISAFLNGTQITATGTVIARSTWTDGTTTFDKRLREPVSVAVGVSWVDSTVNYYTATASGAMTFSLQAQASAGALRVAAQANTLAQIMVEDMGI